MDGWIVNWLWMNESTATGALNVHQHCSLHTLSQQFSKFAFFVQILLGNPTYDPEIKT